MKLAVNYKGFFYQLKQKYKYFLKTIYNVVFKKKNEKMKILSLICKYSGKSMFFKVIFETESIAINGI